MSPTPANGEPSLVAFSEEVNRAIPERRRGDEAIGSDFGGDRKRGWFVRSRVIGVGTSVCNSQAYREQRQHPLIPTQISHTRCFPQVCSLLGLDPSEALRPEFPLVFSGAAPLPGGAPYAQCYGGHQFGNWAGQVWADIFLACGKGVGRCFVLLKGSSSLTKATAPPLTPHSF